MFIISFGLLMIISLQIPTYILVSSLQSSLANQFDDALAQQEAFQASEDTIKQTNALIDYLKIQPETDFQFSGLIYELDAIAGSEVAIKQIILIKEAGVLNNLEVIGEAKTRISLANFRDNLETNEMFTSVELPISNLAKDRNITFSMTVTLNNSDS